MDRPPPERERAAWQRLVRSHADGSLSAERFLAEAKDVDHTALVKSALHGGLRTPGWNDGATALYVAQWLGAGELERIFDELVALASASHGSMGYVRDLILTLRRDWILARVEAAAEPYLREGAEDEYRRFLELYDLLDRDLTLKLARRAVEHQDPDIREAGQEYLEALEPRGMPGAAARSR